MYTITISNANNLLSTVSADYTQVLALLMKKYAKAMAYHLSVIIDTEGSHNYTMTTVDQGNINVLIKRQTA